MSSSTSQTVYHYTYGGSSMAWASDISSTFSLGPGMSGVPTTFTDADAIALAANLQSAWRNSGFADATCAVTKSTDVYTQYSVVGGVFA